MSRIIKIPLSIADDYLIKTFDKERYLRNFNKNLRGLSIPVGDFHEPLHEQVLFDLDTSSKSDISHLANLFSVREPRYNATVLNVEWCNTEKSFCAVTDWKDSAFPPRQLRVTAVVEGKKCIRVLQFGVE